MLQIIVPGTELFDENTNTFSQTNDTKLKLEHSLLSISKWESKWCKPFLAVNKNDHRTKEEIVDYVRCMTLNPNVPKNVYNALTKENLDDIIRYIKAPMTATTVKDSGKSIGEVVTSEIIYYWMVAYNIPFECEKWHINRLIMLIRVCNAKNNPKKMSRQDLAIRNRQLNAARRKALHTKG